MAVHHTIRKLRSVVHNQAESLTRQYLRNALLEIRLKHKDQMIFDLKAQNEILRAKVRLLRGYVTVETQ